jgi:hypothetical protein
LRPFAAIELNFAAPYFFRPAEAAIAFAELALFPSETRRLTNASNLPPPPGFVLFLLTTPALST